MPNVVYVNASELWGLDGLQKFYELAEETPYSSMTPDKIARLQNLEDYFRGRERFEEHFRAVQAFLSTQPNPGWCYVIFDV